MNKKVKIVISILALTGMTVAAYQIYEEYKRRKIYQSIYSAQEAKDMVQEALANG